MKARIDLPAHFYSFALAAAVAVAPFCGALAGAPVVASGKIGSTVHIPQQLSPKVTLDIHGDSQDEYFYWLMPNGQTIYQSFQTSQPSGRYAFQAAPGNGALFGTYAQAGTWTLTQVTVCSYKGCNSYSGTTLATLFPSLDLLVVNPKSDTTPPTVTAATILTPTVAISKHSVFEANLTVQDDVSGVVEAIIFFNNGVGGRGTSFTVGSSLPSPVVVSTAVPVLSVCDCKKFAAGAYNAVEIYLKDAAGNTTTVTDPATISSLLGGQTSITLTD